MREQFISFNDCDVDGYSVLARIYGEDITVGTINRIKDAVCNYKNKNEDEWDIDRCFEVARK